MQRPISNRQAPGRLTARPRPPSSPLAAPSVARGAIVYEPRGSRPSDPMPLLVMFHGAGGRAQQSIDMMRAFAEQGRFRILATSSRGATWDLIEDELGPDVATLDAELERTFAAYAVDRVAVGGFSDGASYALTLGLENGDLFDAVLAFSPGFSAAPLMTGSPRIFVSHGTKDAVLPVDRCSRRIVPRLERAGYDVRYLEFDGPHAVPPEVARAGVSLFAQ